MKKQPLLAGVALALALSACGGSNSANDSVAMDGNTAQGTMPTETSAGVAPSNTSGATLASGPDVCFQAIAKHLGNDVKVSEITSFFSAGSDVDSNDTEPAGTMKSCSVQYQNPQDPRKLVGINMDIATGQFSAPAPIEITVTTGDASSFKLDDYLVPLSSINAAGLSSVMEAQKGRLSGVYSKYAWTGVRLISPGPFSDTHTLRLDVAGRLTANDLLGNGYASVSLDGKSITKDHLVQ